MGVAKQLCKSMGLTDILACCRNWKRVQSENRACTMFLQGSKGVHSGWWNSSVLVQALRAYWYSLSSPNACTGIHSERICGYHTPRCFCFPTTHSQMVHSTRFLLPYTRNCFSMMRVSHTTMFTRSDGIQYYNGSSMVRTIPVDTTVQWKRDVSIYGHGYGHIYILNCRLLTVQTRQ